MVALVAAFTLVLGGAAVSAQANTTPLGTYTGSSASGSTFTAIGSVCKRFESTSSGTGYQVRMRLEITKVSGSFSSSAKVNPYVWTSTTKAGDVNGPSIGIKVGNVSVSPYTTGYLGQTSTIAAYMDSNSLAVSSDRDRQVSEIATC